MGFSGKTLPGHSEVTCVIPARYQSTRFPGKPLIPLLGQPMVIWVAKACEKALGRENVIIATDDSRIHRVAHEFGFRSEDTSSSAMTGTDRVAEVARKLRTTTILNVQGDEPMVSPEDIQRIVEVHHANPSLVVNGYVPLSPQEDPARTTIPKVVLDQQENLLYISRRDIPGSKASEPHSDSTLYLKQVCIYGFSREHLERYASHHQKTHLEEKEDIEILRFLEMGQQIKMVRTQASSLAVDTPGDVAVVEEAMSNLGLRP